MKSQFEGSSLNHNLIFLFLAAKSMGRKFVRHFMQYSVVGQGWKFTQTTPQSVSNRPPYTSLHILIDRQASFLVLALTASIASLQHTQCLFSATSTAMERPKQSSRNSPDESKAISTDEDFGTRVKVYT